MALVRRIRPLLLALALLLSPIGPVACAAQGPSADLGCGTSGVPCLKGKAVVELTTSKGVVQLSLDGDAAPLTAGNFVDLVRRGAYNGTVFHRVVRDPIPFVVQGGDPQGADPKVPVDQLGTGSFIDPATGQPRLIPLELFLQGEAQPRYGEITAGPGQQSKLKLQHERGALAMARSADPNSASSQFYIALKALPELDGRYAVFGRVTQGMEVVDKINQGDRLVKATLVEGGTLVKN
ncbi:peptidylprolyl isomerase [Synechococcus sp. HJ21-Hayes]|jgi:peptidyl-prolyl cis-trans isomerase B (cyclophilin B)|uniref:peptidylprolyl isomerase n=1 Tax=unclassified Synechococcus TaxID=2626047 RepID=UPI0020CB9E1A|nr:MULTISPECIES: peptidylprolyl isomerase [unclassified Synechococcus]MCP9832406.1 peptidylprolyl isomerase [Synechococcus sp. JJ3a-Johnson]MCP9854051.1 peptidylprolyl isomerase [Synechococcus sp. HJ21-Hayes]